MNSEEKNNALEPEDIFGVGNFPQYGPSREPNDQCS
jgi:hypothetical protein